MNQHDARLEQRLARLDRRTSTAPTMMARRAQRTKLATAGASATAIVGLMALYGISNTDANAADTAPSPLADGTDTVAGVHVGSPSELVVVIDAAGNVISAPDSVPDDVVAAAVAARLADGSVATNSLAVVAEPTEIDLAVPAVDSASTEIATAQTEPTQAESANPATETTATATQATTTPTTTTPRTTTPTTTAAAPVQVARQAPQGRSSGS